MGIPQVIISHHNTSEYILVSDDVILFIEHVVSFCACAISTVYFKRAEVVQLPEEEYFKVANIDVSEEVAKIKY